MHYKVKTIRVLVMTSAGRIYLQKRSKLKKENSGLYDKTVGGHVYAGDSFDSTLVKECAEELGFPASIVPEKEFSRAAKSIDLKTVAIIKKLDYDPHFESLRQSGKRKFTQIFMGAFYLGYYDGPIRFADGEASGIETFSMPELKKEIQKSPEKFTQDLKYMVKKYGKILRPL